jgi:hypothetical protein
LPCFPHQDIFVLLGVSHARHASTNAINVLCYVKNSSIESGIYYLSSKAINTPTHHGRWAVPVVLAISFLFELGAKPRPKLQQLFVLGRFLDSIATGLFQQQPYRK